MRFFASFAAVCAAAPLALVPSYAAAATTTVQLTCSGAALGDHVTLSARLVDGTGEQVGGESLTVQRHDEFDAPKTLSDRIRTDAVTAATMADQPPNRGVVTYTASYAGKGQLSPSTGSCTTDVIGTGTQIEVYPDAPTSLGDPLVVRGTMTGGSGAGLTDRAVEIRVDGALAATSTTGYGGLFHSALPSPAVGVHQVTVRYAGDRAQEDAETTHVRVVRTPTQITITGPSRLPRAGYADFVLTLTTAGGAPLPQVWVEAPGDDFWGFTDDAGQIRARRYVMARDPLRLVATYDPNPSQDDERLYAPTTATHLWRGAPEFSFWASQTRYTYGQTGDFSVGQVSTSAWATPPTATATYTPYGQAAQTLAQPAVAGDPFGFRRLLTRNSVVRISSTEDGLYEAGTASYRISVAPRLAQDVRGEWSRDGATWLVRRWVDPVVAVTTKPLRSGTCAYLRVQRYVDGAWRAAYRTDCRRLDSTSSTSWRIGGDFAAGVRIRARWETPSDALNVNGTGAWQVIRFTR